MAEVDPDRRNLPVSAAPARSWELGEGAADGKAHARLFLLLQHTTNEKCSGNSVENRKWKKITRSNSIPRLDWYEKKQALLFQEAPVSGESRSYLFIGPD
jgi:hypothetical protein